MRKVIALLLVMLLCVPLAGCGGKDKPPVDPGAPGAPDEPEDDDPIPGDTTEPGDEDEVKTVTAGPEDLVALVADAKGIFSGYINTRGQWVIAPDYLAGTQFSGGLAAVLPRGKDSHWQIIDKTGTVLVECEKEVQFVPGACFCEGLMRIHNEENSAYGFANTQGQIIVPPIYQWVEDYREGMAAVEENGRWGYVDAQGKQVVPCQYGVGHSFSGGRAYVGDNQAFIDKTGKVVFQRVEDDRDQAYEQFDGDFQDGVALCTCSGDRTVGRRPGLVNDAGVVVWYDRKCEFASPWTSKIHGENLFLVSVRDGDKMGFIDTTGSLVCTVPEGYRLGTSGFSDGLCYIQEVDSQLWGYMDKTGRAVISAIFQGITPFVNGFAAVRDSSGSYVYIDKSGAVAVSGDFTCQGNPFSR